jgi:hypothetical protein
MDMSDRYRLRDDNNPVVEKVMHWSINRKAWYRVIRVLPRYLHMGWYRCGTSDVYVWAKLTLWLINICDNYRLIHGLFHIALVISTRSWYRPRGTISVEGWWQGQYEKGHVLIYLSHILPGQITCYCPRKMLLFRRQITRRKLCFYYTCKFRVISIKYVIIYYTGLIW